MRAERQRQEIRDLLEKAEAAEEISRDDYSTIEDNLRGWTIIVLITSVRGISPAIDEPRRQLLLKEKIEMGKRLRGLPLVATEDDTIEEIKERNFKIARNEIAKKYPNKNFALWASSQPLHDWFHPQGTIIVDTYYSYELRLAIQIDTSKRMYRIAQITDNDPIPPYHAWNYYGKLGK